MLKNIIFAIADGIAAQAQQWQDKVHQHRLAEIDGDLLPCRDSACFRVDVYC